MKMREMTMVPKEEIVEDKKDKMVERVKSNWIETTQILKKRKAAKVFQNFGIGRGWKAQKKASID